MLVLKVFLVMVLKVRGPLLNLEHYLSLGK